MLICHMNIQVFYGVKLRNCHVTNCALVYVFSMSCSGIVKFFNVSLQFIMIWQFNSAIVALVRDYGSMFMDHFIVGSQMTLKFESKVTFLALVFGPICMPLFFKSAVLLGYQYLISVACWIVFEYHKTLPFFTSNV